MKRNYHLIFQRSVLSSLNNQDTNHRQSSNQHFINPKDIPCTQVIYLDPNAHQES